MQQACAALALRGYQHVFRTLFRKQLLSCLSLKRQIHRVLVTVSVTVLHYSEPAYNNVTHILCCNFLRQCDVQCSRIVVS